MLKFDRPDGDHQERHLSAGDDKRDKEQHDHERQKCRTFAATEAARRRHRHHRDADLQLSAEVLYNTRTVGVVLQHHSIPIINNNNQSC